MVAIATVPQVAGVSFMQEGIERADALPRHLHKASVRACFPPGACAGSAQGQRPDLKELRASNSSQP